MLIRAGPRPAPSYASPPPPVVGAGPAGAPASSGPRHVARRFALRFAVVYFALYIPSFPLMWFPRPFGDALLTRLAEPVAPNVVQRWVLTHVLGVEPPWTSQYAGAGDNPIGWANLVCLLAVAAVGAVLWTRVDRRHRHDEALLRALRAAVRLTLGVVMLWYGLTKLAGIQFPAPRLGRLAQPLGELTPMALLWTFMGSSPGYARFAGAVETIGALLLFHRRTATLGALVLVGAAANVLALNLGYDIGQKLSSAHLLAMAVLLVAPDLRRLFDVLVLGRAVPGRDERPPFASPRRTAVARLAWAAYVAFVLVAFVRDVARLGDRIDAQERGRAGGDALAGLYDVEAFAGRAATRDAGLSAWRRLVVERDGFATLTLAGGDVRLLHVARDAAGRRLAVASAPRDHALPAAFSATAYTGALGWFDVSRARATDSLTIVPADADRLRLVGRLAGDSVDVLLRRRAPSTLPLIGWRVHAVWRDAFWPLL